MVYFHTKQKSQLGYIFEGLGMEHVGMFYGHLEYFTAIWYMLVVNIYYKLVAAIWYICIC
jgi:hypothetical protein